MKKEPQLNIKVVQHGYSWYVDFSYTKEVKIDTLNLSASDSTPRVQETSKDHEDEDCIPLTTASIMPLNVSEPPMRI